MAITYDTETLEESVVGDIMYLLHVPVLGPLKSHDAPDGTQRANTGVEISGILPKI